LIAGCQSEAIKRLSPEPLKVTPLLLDKDDTNIAARMIKLLVLSNKPIPHPMVALVQCDKYIQSVTYSVLGAILSSPGVLRRSQNSFQVNENAADWGVTSPLIVTIIYRGSDDVACSVTPH
jgi:hypothetical protein